VGGNREEVKMCKIVKFVTKMGRRMALVKKKKLLEN
jgi:hypothetical protein